MNFEDLKYYENNKFKKISIMVYIQYEMTKYLNFAEI